LKEADISSLKNLLVELARIPSFSNTEQEGAMVPKILEKLKNIPFFNNNPEYLYSWKIPNDSYQRKAVAALLHKGSSPETVILLNHYDVVDIDDYEKYKDIAFDPEKITQAYAADPQITIPREENEEYLFGRGVADMKAGIAIQLTILEKLAAEENFTGNILFLSVPDEETSSRGMLAAAPKLAELKTQMNLNYRAVFNCEPVFPRFPGDREKYLYTGSMGKSVAFFYGRGLETHAGDSLSGLNGNLIIASLINKLENNLAFSDMAQGYKAPPPTCLKARDAKEYYSAKIPHIAGCYYNICLLKTPPKKLLGKLKNLASGALQEVLADWYDIRQEYLQYQGVEEDGAGNQAGDGFEISGERNDSGYKLNLSGEKVDCSNDMNLNAEKFNDSDEVNLGGEKVNGDDEEDFNGEKDNSNEVVDSIGDLDGSDEKIMSRSLKNKVLSPWVISYQELIKKAEDEQEEDISELTADLINKLKKKNIEDQEICLQITDELTNIAGLSGPGIVIGFTPPYYPPVKLQSESTADKKMWELAKKLQSSCKNEHGHYIEILPFFPGISDLSYFRLTDSAETEEVLAGNMPVWGEGYKLPLQEIAELDIPVLNISVQGYDAHKKLERLELNYSLKVVPQLLEYACREMTQPIMG